MRRRILHRRRANGTGGRSRAASGMSGRRRAGLATRAAACLVLLVAALAAATWWARGRGYKTWVLAKFFPESRYAMKHPSVTGIRPADRDSDVQPDVFIACDVELPNRNQVIDKNTLDGAVLLLRGNAREKVPAAVNTSGG